MSAPHRSDVRPASAECRFGASGFTEVELRAQGAKARADLFRRGLLVIDLSDQTLTIGQHDRAVKLGRELTEGM